MINSSTVATVKLEKSSRLVGFCTLLQLKYSLVMNGQGFGWSWPLAFPYSPGIKPFQCDRCGKKFTRAYSLKMHRLKHEGKRCFRCQICSATFTSFGEYKHHMRVSRHIIRKPRIYECKTCGAMFTNSGNLIVHLRSLNHEASELANYFQSRWGVWGRRPPLFTQISPGSENNFSLVSNTWGSFDQFFF